MQSKRTVEIVPVAVADIERLTGRRITWPMITYAGISKTRRGKPRLIAYGGLAWRFYGADGITKRCDIWFDVVEPKLMRPLMLVRWARKMLLVAAQFGDREVFCIRDDHPNSAKLLRLAGLELMDDGATLAFEDGSKRTGEIWRWRQSEPSEPS